MIRYLIALILYSHSGLLVANAASDENSDLQLHILSVTPKEVCVELTNTAKHDVELWDDWNSWGVGHWRILIISGDQYQLFYQSSDGVWTRNGPSHHSLHPGETTKVVLNLQVGKWIHQGTKGLTFAGNTLVVSYDVPPTDEARNLGVWYGVVTTLSKRP